MLARICLGYVLGTLASAFVIGLDLAVIKLVSGSFRDSAGDVASILLFVAMYATAVVGAAALLPSVVLIMYAERNRLRSLRFYLAAAVAAGIVGFELLGAALGDFPILSSFEGLVGHVMQLLIFVVLPGLIAGLVYWGAAGRAAGDTSQPFW